MIQVLLSTLLNLGDYVILSLFFKQTSKKYASRLVYRCLVFGICVILITIINEFGVPEYNIIASTILIFLYSLTFVYSRRGRILAVISYMGACFITEPMGVLFTSGLYNVFKLNIQVSYYSARLVCLLIRFIMMLMIVKYLRISNDNLEHKGVKLLVFESLFSIGICMLIINLIYNVEDIKAVFLCILLIILVLINNILILSFFQRLSTVKEENHSQHVLLEELKAKEEYYEEVAAGNKKVLQIKHDFINKVLAMKAVMKNSEDIDKFWRELTRDLEINDESIFTNNIVFQTVIGHKIAYARKEEIKCSVTVNIPQKINIDYRDCGVLLGNILDNAIEATRNLDVPERWIKVKVVYDKGMLPILIQNSKRNEKVDVNISNKGDKLNHGHGLSGVVSVVEKYNGIIEFKDNLTDLEVNIMLYGIQAIE